MKKLSAVLFVLIFSSIIYPQSPVDKGTVTIGGNISYSSETADNDNDSYNLFLFNPQAGYFFVNNFYTALSLSYVHTSSGENSISRFGIGPAARYYFEAGNVKPFVGAGYSYFTQVYDNEDNDITNTELKFSAGADFFVSKGLAIEGSINYSFIKYDLSDTYYNSDPKIKKFEIAVGVNYFIY